MKLTDDANISWLVGDTDAIARVGHSAQGDLIIEWNGFARLTVDAKTHREKLEPLADLDAVLVRKLERGLARAIPEYLRGALVFHASAVGFAGRGLMILGDTGAGKSTTAALLCERGASLLADDCAVGFIEGDHFQIQPTEDLHWLDRGGEVKEAIAPQRLADRSFPTRTAVLLTVGTENDTDVVVTRCRGVEAARGFLDAMLRVPLGETQSKADFERVAAIATVVQMYKVLRPATFTANLSDKLITTLMDLP